MAQPSISNSSIIKTRSNRNFEDLPLDECINVLSPFFAGKQFIIAGGIFAGGVCCDVDIYPYDMNIDELVRHIYAFCEYFGVTPCARSKNCLVFYMQYEQTVRKVMTQIILCISDSPYDVISRFDITACQCAYDFKTEHIVATRGYDAAQKSGIVKFDPQHIERDTSLTRFAKYSIQKGYNIKFPDNVPNNAIIQFGDRVIWHVFNGELLGAAELYKRALPVRGPIVSTMLKINDTEYIVDIYRGNMILPIDSKNKLKYTIREL